MRWEEERLKRKEHLVIKTIGERGREVERRKERERERK